MNTFVLQASNQKSINAKINVAAKIICSNPIIRMKAPTKYADAREVMLFNEFGIVLLIFRSFESVHQSYRDGVCVGGIQRLFDVNTDE